MAHFINLRGERISRLPVALRPGRSLEVGLSGFRDFQGSRIDVTVTEANSQTRLPIGKVYLTREVGDVCFFRIDATTEGVGRISAIAGGNQIWDWLGLSVSATAPFEESGLDKLVKALDSGALKLQHTHEPPALRAAAEGRGNVFYGPPIVEALNALLEVGEVKVMSMFREGNGAHGLKEGGKIAVWAVDIEGFCGDPITVVPAPRLIEVVAKIIETLPAGNFGLGYPRPTKEGDPPIKSELDVFFKVDTQEKAWKCWQETGWGGSPGGLQNMLSPAKERIKAAIAKSKATFHNHFADGLNHLHIQVEKPFRRAASG